MRRKAKFHVGQIVRLKHDYVSSFGWRINAGALCEITARGINGNCEAAFMLAQGAAPFKFWLQWDNLDPLTKREAGR